MPDGDTALSPKRSSGMGGKGRSARSASAPRPRKLITAEWCAVEGCGKKVNTAIYCKMHYMRWKRWGDPTFTAPNKGRPLSTTPEVRTAIAACIAAGKTQTDVAHFFGVSRDVVRGATTIAGAVCAQDAVCAIMAPSGQSED